MIACPRHERVDCGHCGKTCRNCGEKHGGSGPATCISDAILHIPPPHPQIACLLPSYRRIRSEEHKRPWHIPNTFSFFPLSSSRLLLIKSLGGCERRERERARERHASTLLYLSRQPPSTNGDKLKKFPSSPHNRAKTTVALIPQMQGQINDLTRTRV